MALTSVKKHLTAYNSVAVFIDSQSFYMALTIPLSTSNDIALTPARLKYPFNESLATAISLAVMKLQTTLL